MKICPKCREEKPGVDFTRNKNYPDGRWVYCKACDAARRQTPEYIVKRKARLKVWRAKDPRRQPRAMRKHKYGITHDEFEKLMESQGHGCAICWEDFDEATAQVDHDHETGAVRGLLCRQCNLGLGNFREDLCLLDRAAKYLKEKS